MKLIKRVIKIKNCPSFVDFKPTNALSDFGKYNLIYGWNGTGKTTFSRILNSFEAGANSYSTESSNTEFEFMLDDGSNISSTNLSEFNQIRVFNKDFIDKTIFCEGGPKPIFFLGKESKEDIESIKNLEQELLSDNKDLNNSKVSLAKAKSDYDISLSKTAKEIKEILTTNKRDRYRNYEKPNITQRLQEFSQDLANPDLLLLSEDTFVEQKKVIAQTRLETIKKIELPHIDISEIINEVSAILTRSVTNKAIEKLKSNVRMANWVKEGLEVHRIENTDTCIFCNQELTAARLRELEDHFSTEYQDLLTDISKLKNDCQKNKIQTSLETNNPLYEELSRGYAKAREEAETMIKSFNANMDILINALEEKERNLFVPVYHTKLHEVDITTFEAMNEIIELHNNKTDSFDEQIDKAKQVIELSILGQFSPVQNVLQNEITTADKTFNEIKTRVEEKQAKIEKLKQNLVNYHIPVRAINEGLEKFLGRPDIKLKPNDDGNGYIITRGGSVAKNLSEGERTALAIVYFTVKIQEDGFDLPNSAIVIDDPVSSLDSSAIFQSFSFIKEAMKNAGQLFILTHHFDFFRQVKNWFKYLEKANEDVKYFMVKCADLTGKRNSTITNIDKLLIDHESEYHFLFSILYNFSVNNDTDLENIYPIPNVARKFLESFLAFRVPLGSKEPNIFQRLKLIQFDDVKKTRINRFVETHSHPNYDSGLQDLDLTLLGEAQAITNDIISLVKTEDEKHYNFLIQALPN